MIADKLTAGARLEIIFCSKSRERDKEDYHRLSSPRQRATHIHHQGGRGKCCCHHGK